MSLSRRTLIAAAALGLSSAPHAFAQADPATTPTPRPEFAWWMERHQQKLAELAATKPDLIFIGDSITHDYELTSTAPQYDFLAVWRRFYGDRRAVNLGFNGDSTGNVLWRLENGEMAGISPRVAVLLIGTNNTIQGQTAEATLAGIEAVIATLRRGLPATRILVVGILPSAVTAEKSRADQAVNAALAKRHGSGQEVVFVDVGAAFIRNGAVDIDLYMDPRNTPPGPALHPDADAQARMAQGIEPVLARLLGDTPKL